MSKQDQWTSVRLTIEQRRYIEARASQRSSALGLQVGLADVIREAIELLREHKPVEVDEPAETAA